MALSASIGSKPAVFDVQWHEGDTVALPRFEFTRDGQPLDLSAYSYIAQYEPVGDDRVDFTIDSTQASAGILVLTPPADTGLHERGSWDLRQVSNGVVLRTLIEGKAQILPTVSRV